ncbi:MAG: hypothetical protein ABI651_17000, partial [Verrucomicrobiota bacterium]
MRIESLLFNDPFEVRPWFDQERHNHFANSHESFPRQVEAGGPFVPPGRMTSATTPLALFPFSRAYPRQALARQPWAGGRNPFGIEDGFRRCAAFLGVAGQTRFVLVPPSNDVR